MRAIRANYTLARLQVGKPGEALIPTAISRKTRSTFSAFPRARSWTASSSCSAWRGVGTEGGAGNSVGRHAGPVYAGRHDAGRQDHSRWRRASAKSLAQRIMLELKGQARRLRRWRLNVAQMDRAARPCAAARPRRRRRRSAASATRQHGDCRRAQGRGRRDAMTRRGYGPPGAAEPWSCSKGEPP